MFLDHRPHHPWQKVSIFHYFSPRKRARNHSEEQPQVSIFSYRAVFSHRPVSCPGTLPWCRRGISKSQINGIKHSLSYIQLFIMSFSGFTKGIEGKQGWCLSCFQSYSIQITRSLHCFTMKIRENYIDFDC